MATTLEFSAIVTDGRLPEAVSRKVGAAIRGFNGKRVIVSVKEQKRKRSNNQNAYMWGVVIKSITDAFRDAGNSVDMDDVFLFLKAEVWKTKQVFVTPDGQVLHGLGSSRNWTTMEMEARLEQARAWAAEYLGISIPLPNEHLEESAVLNEIPPTHQPTERNHT
ncbi:MAG: hypothetical protein K8U57_37040 [Planctomycetes bacterium]|nr:hypothetical protein [Planctomycetota bacterium]